MNWYRAHHGMPFDPKFRTIARKSGQRLGDVLSVWLMLLDRASQAEDRGSVAGYDIEAMADALDVSEEAIDDIINAMTGKLLTDDRIASWDKRQVKDEGAADRKRKSREAQKASQGVTDGHDPSQGVTDGHDPSQGVTDGHDPSQDVTENDPNVTGCHTEEIREEKNIKERSPNGDPKKVGQTNDLGWSQFWERYPKKADRKRAFQAFAKARKATSLDDIMTGLERYIAHKPPDVNWMHASTFLNGERWADEHTPQVSRCGTTRPVKNPVGIARRLMAEHRAQSAPDHGGTIIDHEDDFL